MTTVNDLDVGLSGASGTVNFTGSNAPTYITPTLGAALATSINFGGSSLANYVSSTSWTPVITAATPGDISVSYTTKSGFYVRIGALVFLTWDLTFTPTFSTASGNIEITGCPFTASQNCYGQYGAVQGIQSIIDVLNNYLQVSFYIASGSSIILQVGIQENTASALLTVANCLSSGNITSSSGSMIITV